MEIEWINKNAVEAHNWIQLTRCKNVFTWKNYILLNSINTFYKSRLETVEVIGWSTFTNRTYCAKGKCFSKQEKNVKDKMMLV